MRASNSPASSSWSRRAPRAPRSNDSESDTIRKGYSPHLSRVEKCAVDTLGAEKFAQMTESAAANGANAADRHADCLRDLTVGRVGAGQQEHHQLAVPRRQRVDRVLQRARAIRQQV